MTKLLHITTYVLLLCIALLFGLVVHAQEAIEGVWRVSRIDRDFRQEPNRDPEPSLIIFTAQHYSIIWILGDESMQPYAERWSATDDEKRQRFGEVSVNAGTYEVEGSQIKTFPLVARDPEFIGGYFLSDYTWRNGNLILTLLDEYSFDGVQHPWAKGSSGQIHLTLSRLPD